MAGMAQASLEYLMTYGWALVLIAAVVGVLVFLLSSPASGITFSSSDPTKILVKAGAVTGTDAEIRLQNITGGNIEITSVVEQGYSGCTVNGGGTPLQVGAGNQINLKCTAPSDGVGTISIEYTDYAGLDRTVVISSSGSESSGIEVSSCQTLNQAGQSYYLSGDLASSSGDRCITLNTSDVSLDCRGHSITNTASVLYGVYLSGMPVAYINNVTLENCTIEGFDVVGLYMGYADNLNINNNYICGHTTDVYCTYVTLASQTGNTATNINCPIFTPDNPCP